MQRGGLGLGSAPFLPGGCWSLPPRSDLAPEVTWRGKHASAFLTVTERALAFPGCSPRCRKQTGLPRFPLAAWYSTVRIRVLLEKLPQAYIFFLSFAASNNALVKTVTHLLLAVCQFVTS